jgi:hypothetical protein
MKLQNDNIERHAKKTGYKKNKEAYRLLICSIEDFKRVHRYMPFVSWTSIQKQLKNLNILKKMVEVLEDFRTQVLAVMDQPFYRLVAEFIRIPNNRQYIPIKVVFSEGESSEQFINRIQLILSWCCDIITKYDVLLIDDIALFQKEVNSLGTKFDAKATFRSKDWYCLASILKLGAKKGWSRKLLLDKLMYYGHPNRRKKATPEMVLSDMLEGKLDTAERKVTKKEKIVETVNDEEYYKKWADREKRVGDFWLMEEEKLKKQNLL